MLHIELRVPLMARRIFRTLTRN